MIKSQYNLKKIYKKVHGYKSEFPRKYILKKTNDYISEYPLTNIKIPHCPRKKKNKKSSQNPRLYIKL